MYIGEIVLLPFEGGYIEYRIKKIIGNELLVSSVKDNSLNWLNVSDVIKLKDINGKRFI